MSAGPPPLVVPERVRERVEILGASIDRISPAAAIARIEVWIHERPQPARHVVVTGFHGIWTGHQDPAFRAILNQADLFCPDGIAPVWLARVRGEPLGERLPGAELMRRFLAAAHRHSYRSYFYGDTEQTLAELTTRLRQDYPGHRVVGTCSPPFRALDPLEQAAHIAHINAAGADVLWVGLGLPKQERWIAAHRGQLQVPVVIGVGAAFGFLSGQVSRVPAWLGDAGFEWAWRLAMEPRKLWRRDLIDGPRFLWHGLREALAHRLRRPSARGNAG